MYINLLAPRRRRRFPFRQMAAGLLAIGVIAGVGYAAQFLQDRIQEVQVARVQVDDALATLDGKQRTLVAKSRDQALLDVFIKLQSETRDWSTVLRPVSQYLPGGGIITRLAYERKGGVTVEGSAPDLKSLASYLDSLQTSGVFAAVRVVNAVNEGAFAAPAVPEKPGPAAAPPRVQFTLVLELAATAGGAK